MKKIINLFNQWFSPVKPLPPGVFHTQLFTPSSNTPHRLHLRLEEDGTGLMVVDAKTVLHLNQTAAEYAYHLIQNTSDEKAARAVSRRYRINHQQALEDFNYPRTQVETLSHTQDLDPETFLNMERVEPHSRKLSAPYRLDCALTYHVSDGAQSGETPMDRVKRELLTEEWESILKKAWDAGIPHIIFTGGEPTLRPDLPELISYAEELGQVTGLLTDGSRISETGYLKKLLTAGLDHMMILLDPSEDQAWEALRDVLAEDIHLTVHLTIHPKDVQHIKSTLEKLKQMGVTSISLSISNPSLKSVLQEVRQKVTELELQLVWDLPVPYSNMHPVALELAEEPESAPGAGNAWLYVEPDGDVLPAQGVLEFLGNFLTDSWQNIWQQAQHQ